MEGKLPALNETLEFYNLLKLKKIKLIILTGRRDYMEDVVRANLQEAGYGDWTKLILKGTPYSGTTFEFKAEERRKFAEKDEYRIIGNMVINEAISKGFTQAIGRSSCRILCIIRLEHRLSILTAYMIFMIQIGGHTESRKSRKNAKPKLDSK
ncbi:hypothetical protein Patl1_22928 [Pistacia atlantica]|uniref:Uncharacterized protein n=1 Tax=Pistacia atlantica TaxID=434234 RepID=A0ACC0ZWF4_9ROSI|nr:hypothetical protein Patl1_22928 [Pistacia atlantica]